MQQNTVIKSLFDRKSVRVFEDRPIEEEKRQLLLEAALQAPTAGNMTLYTIIEVTDQALKDRLSITCDNQPFIAKAPMVLIFLADYQRWYDAYCQVKEDVRVPGAGDLFLAMSDALIAAQNVVVAAQALSLGSCYIGDILERYEEHRELLHLPPYAVPVCMLCMGYPTKQQLERQKPQRPGVHDVVCQNTYGFTEDFSHALARKEALQGEAFVKWLAAFCDRKWNSDFSREMTRSVKVMLSAWEDGEKAALR